MQHVPQTDIIKFAAGELDHRRKAEIERHMEHCAACRQALRDQTAVWQKMDDWTPPQAESDLFSAIEDQLGSTPTPKRSSWSRVESASRVAAAIIIGAGVGFAAARTSQTRPQAASQVSAEDAKDAALAALRVDHFETYAPAGLTSAWQDLTTSDETEEQP